MKKLILNKYRNDLGRKFRKLYEAGIRDKKCRRSLMRSYQSRTDLKSGVLGTFVRDNLVLELLNI